MDKQTRMLITGLGGARPPPTLGPGRRLIADA